MVGVEQALRPIGSMKNPKTSFYSDPILQRYGWSISMERASRFSALVHVLLGGGFTPNKRDLSSHVNEIQQINDDKVSNE